MDRATNLSPDAVGLSEISLAELYIGCTHHRLHQMWTVARPCECARGAALSDPLYRALL